MGVVTLFSCSPNEISYELEALQQGIFTHALLEGLGARGQCATVERLSQYLARRVPELSHQHGCPVQTPYAVVEPIEKCHLILLPQYLTPTDIATLKTDAYRAAQLDGNWQLSEQLWIQVLTASAGMDMEAVRALQSIGQLRHQAEHAVPMPVAAGSVLTGTPLPIPNLPIQPQLSWFTYPDRSDRTLTLIPETEDTAKTAQPTKQQAVAVVEGDRPAQQAHTDAVTALAVSLDGRILASGSADQTLRLWRLPKLQPLQCCRGHSESITAVAFSPDGHWLASGSGDNTIKLWNCQTGELQTTLRGHQGWVLALAFLPNEPSLLVSGSADGTLNLWNWEKGQIHRTLSGHQGWVGAIAVHSYFNKAGAKETLLVSGSHDHSIKLWRLETGKLLHTLSGHRDRVLGLALHPNGKWLLSLSRDGTMGVWHWRRGKLLRLIKGMSNVQMVAFNPNGQAIATVCTDGSIQQQNVDHWGRSAPNAPKWRSLQPSSIIALAFASSTQLVMGDKDGRILLQKVQPSSSSKLWLAGGLVIALGLLGLQTYALMQQCKALRLPLTQCITLSAWED